MFARSLTGCCLAVKTAHLQRTLLPQPCCFLTSLFWSLGSRREEALHFSAAGFVPSIFCAFPTLYLTAFLAEIKDMVEALTHQCTALHFSVHLYPSLLLCVFLLQAFFFKSDGRVAFQVLAPAVLPLASVRAP